MQLFKKLIMIDNVIQLLVLIKTFFSSIVDRIFGYLENILHNDTGNNVVRLNANTTTFPMTAIEPAERNQIYKNETCQKMHNHTNNHSSEINNKFRVKDTLQKKINFKFRNTEPAYFNTEALKESKNNSGLYYGIFYENMVGYYYSKIK